jgi:tight adherence protein B
VTLVSRRDWLRAAALCLLTVGAFAAAAPAASHADPGADIAVTGVQYGKGTVSFLASARGLPKGTSLEQANLKVWADGRQLTSRIEAVEAAPGRAPTRAVVVVVDTSGSMAGGRIIAARQAAAEYARVLPADVRLGLVTVASTASVLLAPTVNRAAYAAAVAKLKADGKTALYDGVQQAATLLRTGFGGDAQRRIVVLSDGEDTASRARLDDVVSTLRRDGTTADVVGFQLGTKGAAAKKIADGSGGKMLSAADANAVAAAFRFVASSFSAPVRVIADVPLALDGRAVPLQIKANLAGHEVGASTAPGTLHAADVVAKPLPRYSVTQPPNWLIHIMAGTIFGGLFLLLATVLRPMLARAQQRRRIGHISKFTNRGDSAQASGQGHALAQSVLSFAERAVRKRGGQERIALELERAGITLRPHEWTLLRIGVAVGVGIVLSLFVPVPFGLIGVPVGWLATKVYRTQRASKRSSKFAAQLPDALQLVVGSLQSGFSLAQAVNAVVRDSQDPIGPELGRALSATRLGTSLEDGLEAVAHRVGSQDLEWAVMTIRIQREVGGNLAEVLQTAVGTMRERDGLRRHVRALSAEGRMSAWVLTGMPIAVAIFMAVLRGEYLRPLYTELIGMGMLGSAVTMVVFGAWWMSRLIKVDV